MGPGTVVVTLFTLLLSACALPEQARLDPGFVLPGYGSQLSVSPQQLASPGDSPSMSVAAEPRESPDAERGAPKAGGLPPPAVVRMPVGSGDWLPSAPVKAPGGREPSPRSLVDAGSASSATDYPDPTELDHYKDYAPEPPRAGGLEKSLAAIAADMAPGEWRQLPDARYLGDGMWADKATWDPARKRVSYVGMHGIPERPVKWVMWDVDADQWHRQTGDEFHPYAGIHSEWGYRSYGRYTQLPDGSNVFARFSRLWKQDPETLEWSLWTNVPCYKEIGNLEAFPEMGEEGSVVFFGAMYAGADQTRLCAYDIARGEWLELPRPEVQGRHSMMRYNAVRGEILLLGGDASWRTAQTLQPDGSLVTLPDAPRNTRIRTDQLIYDPVSGDYLVMVSESDESRQPQTVEFFGFDVSKREWYLIDQWSTEGQSRKAVFNYHAHPVVTAIPEDGVTLWMESTRTGVFLYKHDPPS
ncbi:MAG: hypothetical protein FKY71_07590 [Spiribacter salinus]|uniref:Galactose oxidase n=1 Tax=Spiribacter salinus TaxID=1335746 RepID=A0A540VS83_9GAMM|nr:MAG: hypothetical protein FKY71_07590 [Spiribacter salinus]